MYIIYYPAGIYLKLLVHREIDFKLDNTWEDDALFWKVRSDDCKFEDNNCIILKLTYLTIQPVFIWSYLCIGRLISNLITRERKMLFFERCALPWMKVTLAYQDKLTNTLNLKKKEKKRRFIFLAKCGGFFFVHTYVSTVCISDFHVFGRFERKE